MAAVRLGATDLAVGDLFGSSMANMLILAIIDLLHPRQQVLQRATLAHALTATLAISLNALAVVLVIARPEFTVAGVGPGSVLLFLACVAGIRLVYRHALRDSPGAPPSSHHDSPRAVPSLRRAALGFLAAAIAVLVAAPAFAWSAKGLAEITGLGQTFVGTWLVGLATSLPVGGRGVRLDLLTLTASRTWLIG